MKNKYDEAEQEISKKIVYMEKNTIANFPDFEKAKYFGAAQKVYDSADIREYINRIEIKGNLDCSGECDVNVENGQVTIRIASKHLGIIAHSGYVHEYTEEQCKEFTDILAHELFHAKDDVEIIQKFGIVEYKSIREIKNEVPSMPREILSEYSACRQTAEQYDSYDSKEESSSAKNYYERIKKEVIQNKEEVSMKVQSYMYYMNYAIATRCAFADVSGDELKHLGILSSVVDDYDNFTKYICALRLLFNEYYDLQPLDKAKYQELGDKMMCKLLSSYDWINYKVIKI